MGLGDWFPIIMITLFDLGDLIGKGLPAVYPIFHKDNAPLIWIPLAFHFLWIPLFFAGVYWADDTSFWGNEWYYMTIVTLMGITAGYIGCSGLMVCPQLVSNHYEKEVAGMIETFFLVSGLMLGSLLGLVYAVYLLPPPPPL